jgi:hypothetical protein
LFNPAWATPKRDDEDNDDGSTKANGPETARSTESDAEIVAIRAHLFVLVSSSKSHASFLLFSEREKLFSDDDDFNDFEGEEVDFFSARRKKSARRDDDDDALVRDLELAMLHIAFCPVIIILVGVVVLIVVVVVVIIPLLSVAFCALFFCRGYWREKKWIKSLLFGGKKRRKNATLFFTHRRTLLALFSAFACVEQTRKR